MPFLESLYSRLGLSNALEWAFGWLGVAAHMDYRVPSHYLASAIIFENSRQRRAFFPLACLVQWLGMHFVWMGALSDAHTTRPQHRHIFWAMLDAPWLVYPRRIAGRGAPAVVPHLRHCRIWPARTI